MGARSEGKKDRIDMLQSFNLAETATLYFGSIERVLYTELTKCVQVRFFNPLDAGEAEAQGDGRLSVQQCRQEVWAADWGPAGNMWKEEGWQDRGVDGDRRDLLSRED